MPSKPAATTPDDVDAELAASEAEANRLADKAAAIRQAGDETRAAVELAELRTAYATLPKAAREARDAAQAELDAVAAADTLDLPALLEAFDRAQILDAECGGVAAHVAALDQVDPLPRTAQGIERSRPPQSQRIRAGARFSDFLDQLVANRADAAGAKRAAELRDELNQAIDVADRVARSQAAQLADGERLAVDSPERIAAVYHDLVATITDEEIQDAHAAARAGSGASLLTVTQHMHQGALDALLAFERGDVDEDDEVADQAEDEDQDQDDDQAKLDGDDDEQSDDR
jgi:hypothetical protein